MPRGNSKALSDHVGADLGGGLRHNCCPCCGEGGASPFWAAEFVGFPLETWGETERHSAAALRVAGAVVASELCLAARGGEVGEPAGELGGGGWLV